MIARWNCYIKGSSFLINYWSRAKRQYLFRMVFNLSSEYTCYECMCLCNLIGFFEHEYSWIADQRDAHEKSIFRRTRRVTTIPRPPLENSWQGRFRSAWYIFVKFIFNLLFFRVCENRVPTKIYQAELDSPRRIL